MFHTIIGTVSIEKLERVASILEDIFLKDPTFSFNITTPTGDLLKKYKKLIIIESDNKNQAFQRGEWIIKKLSDLGVDKFYWIKETK